jgi:hypothetical protein
MELHELRAVVLVGLLASAVVGIGTGTGLATVAGWILARWRRAAGPAPHPRAPGGPEIGRPSAGVEAAARVLRRQAWWRLRC